MADPAPPPPDISPKIPDKLYFRIGEVAKLAGIKPYVLRFWESEFGRLGPRKSGTGQRVYRRKDVEMVLEIKRLLYEKRFTIAGARQYLEDHRKQLTQGTPEMHPSASRQGELFPISPAVIVDIRRSLEEILELMNGEGGRSDPT